MGWSGSDSMIELSCPHCKADLKIADRDAGRRGKCQHCLGAITVPGGADIDTPPGTGFRASVIPTGDAFAETVVMSSSNELQVVSAAPVPSGRELVVLQVRFSQAKPICTLDSRRPAPYEDKDSILLSILVAENTVNQSVFINDFPDGTVVVDEGRELWVASRHEVTLKLQTKPQSAFTVLGYYRDKP